MRSRFFKFGLNQVAAGQWWLKFQVIKFATGRGEISKQRKLNNKKWYRVVRDLSFYETRRILKFSFKDGLMKEIGIFLNLTWTLNAGHWWCKFQANKFALGMAEISKRRQLNKKKCYGEVEILSFYEMG